MKGSAKYILLLACFLMAATIGKAQMIHDTLELLELNIVANKINYTETTKHQSIDSLYKKQLDHLDLGELLSASTPIFVRSYGKGTLSTASFRGTGSSHTQVLWNGFRLNSPMLGQTDLSTIPNSLFDKVELFYGGASLINAEGGLGGGINLVNTSGNNQKPVFYLTQSAGSFKTFSTAAGLSVGKGSFKSDTRVIFQTSQNNFPFYNDAVIPPGEMTQQNAEYGNTGFTQQFSYKPAENHTLSFSTWNQWNKRNIPPVMSNYEQVNWLRESSGNFFSRNILGWEYQKNRTQTSVKAAYFFDDYRYNQEMIGEGGSGSDSIINSINKSSGVFVNAKLVQDLRNGFVVTACLNVERNTVKSNNYRDDADRNNIGLVGKVEKLFWDKLNLSLLVRSQVVDGELLPLMPVFGLNFRILNEEQLFFRASISRNYHLPTLNDLYWYPGGNPDLKPEDSFEVEGGLNYVLNINHSLSLKADLTAYANSVNNWILWEDTGNGYWSAVNKREVFARGMEFFTQLDARKGKSWYRVFLQYAFTRTTDETDGGDEQLIYIPVHNANGYFQWSYRGYSLEWKTHFVGEQNTIGKNLPAYLINHVSAGKMFWLNNNKLELRFRVNNLFDVHYQAVLWRPMPGRNYELFVSFQLNRKQ
jgi:iron complex outermembrane receptor protein